MLKVFGFKSNCASNGTGLLEIIQEKQGLIDITWNYSNSLHRFKLYILGKQIGLLEMLICKLFNILSILILNYINLIAHVDSVTWISTNNYLE